jgi:hypothetical protein
MAREQFQSVITELNRLATDFKTASWPTSSRLSPPFGSYTLVLVLLVRPGRAEEMPRCVRILSLSFASPRHSQIARHHHCELCHRFTPLSPDHSQIARTCRLTLLCSTRSTHFRPQSSQGTVWKRDPATVDITGA